MAEDFSLSQADNQKKLLKIGLVLDMFIEISEQTIQIIIIKIKQKLRKMRKIKQNKQILLNKFKHKKKKIKIMNKLYQFKQNKSQKFNNNLK